MPSDDFYPCVLGRDGLRHLPHFDAGPVYWGSLCMTSDVPRSQHRRVELIWMGPTCFECMRVKRVGIDARERYEAELKRKRALR